MEQRKKWKAPCALRRPPRTHQSRSLTGTSSYIALWLVKLLLDRSYTVHASVRDPCEQPQFHLSRCRISSNARKKFRLLPNSSGFSLHLSQDELTIK
ncbi:Cinnamoyl-CoA reductase 2 [Carex littledalei]|uniref:Cinnamoyl-CoA reductase 2 n=1 Tax=Carex littledalei TaxID=544730 RepID=A0A833VD75_9POAL|nr:Cinnamoyl-CoA reductase 2 [Carex littledalei]